MAASDFGVIDTRLLESITTDMDVDAEFTTIEDFLEFSTAELKYFLLNMGESVAGQRAELAERATLAQKRKNDAGSSKPKKFKFEKDETKGDYATTLEEYGLVDPDSANEWNIDVSGLPSLDTGKIFHYILTKEAFDTYYLSEYKTKKAYQYVESACIRNMKVHTVADYIFVKGTVAALNQTGDGFDNSRPANIVKIITTSENDVIVSCCTCTANLYQCCNHVIALLFRIECLIHEMDSRETVMADIHVPNPGSDPENFKPIKICDLFKKKDPYATAPLRGKIHKPSAEEKKKFMEQICQAAPNSLFAQIFRATLNASTQPQEIKCPTQATMTVVETPSVATNPTFTTSAVQPQKEPPQFVAQPQQVLASPVSLSQASQVQLTPTTQIQQVQITPVALPNPQLSMKVTQAVPVVPVAGPVPATLILNPTQTTQADQTPPVTKIVTTVVNPTTDVTTQPGGSPV